MNEANKMKVYILGAGCSAKYGYPLAKDFTSELDRFGKTLNEGATELKRCIDETVSLMRREAVETIDDLAVRLHAGNYDESRSVSLQTQIQRRWRIQRAKIATAALLLSREAPGNRTGLKGYHDLLLKLCPGPGDWQYKLQNSKCKVLSFNYDRLFELAFVSRAGVDVVNNGLYGETLLNSGFRSPLGREIEFKKEGFSFLKLHGSVGARVMMEFGILRFCPNWYAVNGKDFSIQDSLFFDTKNEDEFPEEHTQPLLVFPHEKHHVLYGGQDSLYGKYLSTVWSQAEAIIAEAREVWIIGYSFAALDRDSIIKLLLKAKNCERAVIQNPDAKQICEMLSIEHPEVEMKWVPYTAEF